MDDAVLGGELTVPTFTGRLALTIPEGTQNGRRFRLAGQGMPALNNSAGNPKSDVGHRGDLFATVKVKLPSKFSEEELDLFKNLRAKRTGAPEPPEAPAAEDSGEQDAGADEE